MVYPAAFLKWGDFDLRNKWMVLLVVQSVMFGMGTQMSLKDFAGVMKMPWGVVVAVGCQFTVAGENAVNAIYPNLSVFWFWDKSGKIVMR